MKIEYGLFTHKKVIFTQSITDKTFLSLHLKVTNCLVVNLVNFVKHIVMWLARVLKEA